MGLFTSRESPPKIRKNFIAGREFSNAEKKNGIGSIPPESLVLLHSTSRSAFIDEDIV